MKKIIIIFVLLTGIVLLYGQENSAKIDNLTFVKRALDFTVGDSVDNTGNLYIRYHAYLPSVLTFVNSDGSVTVCTSDDNKKVTYVYEYSANLEEIKILSFQNELGSLGAFTKDNEGNYYFFYGAKAGNRNTENMALVKYNHDQEKINTFKLKATPPSSFSGIAIPFDAGTCRLELSGSMIAVYFAREMFNGHQASYGFVLDKDNFSRIDSGAATNANRTGGNTQIPYASHSFNQFILPIENGFIFADHGDAYPRSFTFAKFIRGSNTKRVHAFSFPGTLGANPTYAQMGGIAKASAGYIFCGTYGRVRENPRNLFTLTFDENMNACTNPVYLTNYTRDDGHAGHPKIVSLNDGRYLLLWERFSYSTQTANLLARGRTEYLSTYALLINEEGKALGDPQEIQNIRLNMNDTLRFNPFNDRVYWAINDRNNSITVYSLEP